MLRRGQPILAGASAAAASPVVAGRQPVARGVSPEGVLQGLLVPRKTSRSANQRQEARHYQLTDSCTVSVQAGECVAKVVNMSRRGLAVEMPLEASIGERVAVLFDGFEAIEGRIVWRRDNRMGIDLGEPKIDLTPVR